MTPACTESVRVCSQLSTKLNSCTSPPLPLQYLVYLSIIHIYLAIIILYANTNEIRHATHSSLAVSTNKTKTQKTYRQSQSFDVSNTTTRNMIRELQSWTSATPLHSNRYISKTTEFIPSSSPSSIRYTYGITYFGAAPLECKIANLHYIALQAT